MSTKRRMGPFILERKLGVGGMGVVYQATYIETGRKVALKALSPGLASNEQLNKRFEREMQILKRLRHENVVQYFGGGKSGGQLYYAMELMEGGSVEDVLAKKKRLPWEEALDITRQVAQALEYSHNQGVIHRDLKPANLFIGKEGRIKLGDFGIARDTGATALTAAGKTVGTYAYMAPEQIASTPPVSNKTDLYALGCVSFELLTGRTPFDATTPAEMLFMHLNDDPPRVREFNNDCPVWFEEVIDRLLEKKPEDRYFDALATQVALDDVKTKVEQQLSFIGRTSAGTSRATKVSKEDRDLIRTLKGETRKKKRKKKKPLLEQTWFLATCLAALLIGVGGLTYWNMFPSEERLYVYSNELMASDSPSDWDDARRRYIEQLLSRFPDGRYAEEAQGWIDRIEMSKRERQAITRARLSQPPRSAAEQLFVEAWQFQRFGDRVTALEYYEDMANILASAESTEDNQIFLRLANSKIAAIKAEGGLRNRDELLRESMGEAYRQYREGNLLEAKKVWEGVINLYGHVAECAVYVELARQFESHRPGEMIDFELPDWMAAEAEPAAIDESPVTDDLP
ncbi:serine/threonine protein kinase [Stratiformator vulcanicus]|uniref:non-specific serine/threonine protein kinase n=1 Tax=Stratiformator vulcanicus TaxID=2527980 RepID=A0A517R6L7_9PLAN|nr:serine/threonine-protein kinase [Stratiformator vulcanicus]QDT39546.1 Serine/threonine-protein kinase PknL [Stratiformator vulcanicus]